MRLKTIANTTNGATVCSHAYLYDAMQRRTQATLEDASMWKYTYNDRNELVSAGRFWSDWAPVTGQQFEYAFDDIGNRTSSKAGGDAAGAALRSATYSANTVNQLTQRDVPGAVDIIGAATATATSVTVNSQSSYRRGEYYQVPLAINNASSAQWTSVSNLAVQSGTTNTVIGNTFLAQTPETPSYDADGNLTNDGRWMLTWDAENHLTKIESQTSAPSASKRKITFDHDWRGRLIRRTEYNGASGSYVVTNDVKYLSDGWHGIAELNATNNALLRAYLWGSDVSGTMSGAGGVGGLLEVNSISNGVHFCAYDANGNVTALFKGTDGTSSANYEFEPFGQAIRCTGVMAKENPYRFSTKRADDATDLVHYELRTYRPATGTWLSHDPFLETAFARVRERNDPEMDSTFDPELNEYGFVANDPEDSIDYKGGGILCDCSYSAPDPEMDAGPTVPDDSGKLYSWCTLRNQGATVTWTTSSACVNRIFVYYWCFNCSKRTCTIKVTLTCTKNGNGKPAWKYSSHVITKKCP